MEDTVYIVLLIVLFHLFGPRQAEQKLKSNTIFPQMQKYHDFQWKQENFVQNLGGEGYYFKLCIAIGQW
jgi:hypothetical protein